MANLLLLDDVRTTAATAQCVHDQAAVAAALDRMAAQITERVGEHNPLVLCVINGGIVVAGQLLTRLSFPLNLDSILATRYRNQTSGGDIHWVHTPTTSLSGRVVLIIDDVLDEGHTLLEIVRYCREQGAKAAYSAVLVEKQRAQPKPIAADIVGLYTPDLYLFGYGMDYKGYLRNAPGIFACRTA